MKVKVTILILAISIQLLDAQALRVYFKDKGGESAIPALSDETLKKRASRCIELDDRDYPVNSAYLNEISELGGAILMKSRWFNYALVEGVSAAEVRNLPWVKRVELSRKYKLNLARASNSAAALPYGKSANQIEMLNGHKLHDLGFTGEGMTIAVIDAGFLTADTAAAFDSLWMNNRILGTYNFRGNTTNVFTGGRHGASVLSILGAYLENEIIGSAPGASYWLLKSEYEPTETPVEMDYWLEAAEYADSVGADIITSSLGYSTFDDPDDSYTYADMDGNTTLVTRAADMAAAKGMLVVVSAGNAGSSPWKYITAPADGDSVLAIGALAANRQRASFSSIGPTADGRIKPDLMAQGQGTAFSNSDFAVFGNGTSFSCPVVSGLAACLWQVNPSKGNMEVFQTMIQSASQHWAPDNSKGFGVPNFEHAAYSLDGEHSAPAANLKVYPVPMEERLTIEWNDSQKAGDVQLLITDLTGRIIHREITSTKTGSTVLNIALKGGIYFLKISIDGAVYSQKLVK